MSKSLFKKTLKHYSKTIFLSLIASLFISGVIKEISITIDLTASHAKVLEKQEYLSREMEYALEKKEKLQNDDYLLIYAKGKYYMSENEDEQIFINIKK